MEPFEPYKILGLDPSSDGEELKAAYRFLSKKYHPDLSGDSRTALQFSRVVKAYKSLDFLSRKESLLQTPVLGSHAGDDIFSLGSIALTSPDSAERRAAVRKLGFSGKKTAYVFLRRALTDRDESVVIAAVRSVADLSLFQAEGEMAALWARSSRTVREAVLDVAETTGERLFKAALELAAKDAGHLGQRARRLSEQVVIV